MVIRLIFLLHGMYKRLTLPSARGAVLISLLAHSGLTCISGLNYVWNDARQNLFHSNYPRKRLITLLMNPDKPLGITYIQRIKIVP